MHKNQMKAEIEKIYQYRIEMHVHTAPPCDHAEKTPEEAVRHYKQAGFHGMVITNHFVSRKWASEMGWAHTDTEEDYLLDYVDAYTRAYVEGEKLGIRVFLGAEAGFYKNTGEDYLIYGADENTIRRVHSCLDADVSVLKQTIKDERTVIVQAHPFRGKAKQTPEGIIDGVEILNDSGDSRDVLAMHHAVSGGFGIVTAGSDYHGNPIQSGCAIRTAYLPKDSFELANILRSGDYVLEIAGHIVLPVSQ